MTARPELLSGKPPASSPSDRSRSWVLSTGLRLSPPGLAEVAEPVRYDVNQVVHALLVAALVALLSESEGSLDKRGLADDGKQSCDPAEVLLTILRGRASGHSRQRGDRRSAAASSPASFNRPAELARSASERLAGCSGRFPQLAAHGCIESAHHASFISFNTPGHAAGAAWNNRLSLDVLVEHVRLCSGPGLRALNL